MLLRPPQKSTYLPHVTLSNISLPEEPPYVEPTHWMDSSRGEDIDGEKYTPVLDGEVLGYLE